MVDKKYLAITELIGTIVGAGFLAIPFVMMRSGAGIGLFHLFFIGVIICLIMLYLGEISLRTKSTHQLTGYASKYLGKTGKKIMFAAVTFEVVSAVIAYMIAEGISISYLFFGTSKYAFLISLAFWIIMSAMIYHGIKALKSGEFFGVLIILIIVALITIIFAPQINIENLLYNNFNNFFAPFGVVLFAYLAVNAVTEVRLILGKEQKKMKSSIIYAHIIAFVVYAIFALVVLGVKGSSTPEIATLSLGKPFIFLGILTMLTSYLSLSVSLMDNLRFDYKMKKTKSWLITILAPLAIFLLLHIIQKTSFTLILGIGGVVSGSAIIILATMMHKRAKILGDRKPEYSIPYFKTLSVVLSTIVIIGAILEIIAAIIN